jgi:hypothetical protein
MKLLFLFMKNTQFKTILTKRLKAFFPNQDFKISVKNTAIFIDWNDGATREQVDNVLKVFEPFPSDNQRVYSEDIKTIKAHYNDFLKAQGLPVAEYYNFTILKDRKITAEGKALFEEALLKKYGGQKWWKDDDYNFLFNKYVKQYNFNDGTFLEKSTEADNFASYCEQVLKMRLVSERCPNFEDYKITLTSLD